MAQQGKQIRVGAREGFAYHSVKLGLLANGNRYDVDSSMYFISGKAHYPFEVLPCPNSDHFLTHIPISSMCFCHTSRLAVWTNGLRWCRVPNSLRFWSREFYARTELRSEQGDFCRLFLPTTLTNWRPYKAQLTPRNAGLKLDDSTQNQGINSSLSEKNWAQKRDIARYQIVNYALLHPKKVTTSQQYLTNYVLGWLGRDKRRAYKELSTIDR
jgi:hypothetical protein